MALAIRTTGVWFGAPERPALGWLTAPEGTGSRAGVLVLPPIGYPYWSAHRTLRELAERLAAAGHLVLRVDYDGTGDSAGDQWDPRRFDAWRLTVREAADLLRSLGADELTLVGAQLGATLAILAGAESAAAGLVAWSPLVAGRRFVRELRLLSDEVPPGLSPAGTGGARVMAGTVMLDETLSTLGDISLAALDRLPAARALILDGDDGAAERAAAPLRACGCSVTVRADPEARQLLETPPEFALPPQHLLRAVADWIGPPTAGTAGAAGALTLPGAASFSWRGQPVREEVLRLDPAGHVAILTEPATAVGADGPTLVLLNPGSETHIGPGRAWVEIARDLALRGRRAVRVDFLGWGESPDAGRAPGRPYDQTAIDDACAITAALRERGLGPVVLFGLCASAWIALRAVLAVDADGVIALNPQMYWKPGDPVDIDWSRIRRRRADEIASVERGARLGIWSALDAAGHRPRVARWLDDLAGCGVPVELLFSEGDDGLVYLRQRFARRLGRLPALRVTELPGVDHPLHRTWLRPQVTEAIDAALGRIAARIPLAVAAQRPAT